MVQFVNYGLQIEIIAIGLFIYGFAVFLRAIRNITKEFQFAIVLVLLSLVMEVMQAVMVRVLVIKSIASESFLW
jgi:hypothetical protein